MSTLKLIHANLCWLTSWVSVENHKMCVPILKWLAVSTIFTRGSFIEFSETSEFASANGITFDQMYCGDSMILGWHNQRWVHFLSWRVSQLKGGTPRHYGYHYLPKRNGSSIPLNSLLTWGLLRIVPPRLNIYTYVICLVLNRELSILGRLHKERRKSWGNKILHLVFEVYNISKH